MKGKEYKAVNGWLEMEDVEYEEVFDFNKDYAKFLDDYRTEREFVKGAIELLEAEGFKNLEEFTELKKGDKFY
ncbi:MAG: aminopeptidase, partial [Halanaerobiales bacterium]